VVGVESVLRVAVVGIILATILGTLIGVGRFSRNAIVRGVCYAYVEFFRNIPVLIQLLMWYLLFTDLLPPMTEAISVGGLFHLSDMSHRGTHFFNRCRRRAPSCFT